MGKKQIGRFSNYDQHINKYRKKHPNKKCVKCGKPLTCSNHHKYCNRCWWIYGNI